MLLRNRWTAAAFVGPLALMVQVAAQGTLPSPAQAGGPLAGAPAGAAGRQGGGGRGATFPAQQRPPGDAALIARGKTIFGINCGSCHGLDARGGDQGGPNLLRSQLVLNDQDGELIAPVVLNGRSDRGMDPVNLPQTDIQAVAAYLHSLAAAGRARGSSAPLNVLVGSAQAGQTYFAARCASCHSPEGDLKGIGSRIPDPKALQNLWVSGGAGGGRGGGPAASGNAAVTVTVTLPSGQKVEGRAIRLDDFLVSLVDASGVSRSFRRNGDMPKVEIHDPLAQHKALFSVYTDKDIHDVTAYLVTLK